MCVCERDGYTHTRSHTHSLLHGRRRAVKVMDVRGAAARPRRAQHINNNIHQFYSADLQRPSNAPSPLLSSCSGVHAVLRLYKHSQPVFFNRKQKNKTQRPTAAPA